MVALGATILSDSRGAMPAGNCGEVRLSLPGGEIVAKDPDYPEMGSQDESFPHAIVRWQGELWYWFEGNASSQPSLKKATEKDLVAAKSWPRPFVS